MTGDNNITRRRFVSAATVAGALGVAGCSGDGSNGGDGNGGNGGNDGGGQPNTPTNTPAVDIAMTKDLIGDRNAGNTLLWWADSDQSPDTSNNGEVSAEAARVPMEPWAENNPQFNINPEWQPALDQWRKKMLQLSTQNPEALPNISHLNHPWLPELWDHLTPVTEAISDIEDDFFPFVELMAKRPDDEWISGWFSTDTRALYYRQDMIDKYADGEPPQTWEQVIQVGQDIAENEDMDGYMYSGGRWAATTFDHLGMFWGQGGKAVDYDTGKYVLPDHRDKMLNVLKFLRETVETGASPQRVANITDYELLAQAATKDSVGMFLGGNWQLQTGIKPAYDGDEWQNWQVTQVPQKGPDMQGNSAGGWNQGIFHAENDQALSAAKDWVASWVDKQNMADHNRIAGSLPTRQSIYEDVDYFANDPYQVEFAKGLEHARPAPGFGVWSLLTNEFVRHAGSVITGQTTPKEAMNTLIQNLDEEVSDSLK